MALGGDAMVPVIWLKSKPQGRALENVPLRQLSHDAFDESAVKMAPFGDG